MSYQKVKLFKNIFLIIIILISGLQLFNGFEVGRLTPGYITTPFKILYIYQIIGWSASLVGFIIIIFNIIFTNKIQNRTLQILYTVILYLCLILFTGITITLFVLQPILANHYVGHIDKIPGLYFYYSYSWIIMGIPLIIQVFYQIYVCYINTKYAIKFNQEFYKISKPL